jgi:hypothetical protein
VVHGAHVKNRPGRTSDMSDPHGLVELHAHGLLRSGVVPPEPIRRWRDYQRRRQDHLQRGSAPILHMQKALDRMNIKIHEVLSPLTGASGLRILRPPSQKASPPPPQTRSPRVGRGASRFSTTLLASPRLRRKWLGGAAEARWAPGPA